ncbi:efflux RND transporter periplasmic adaptor subunit [Herbaspirillum sp. alder98]|uniref:efflux RND transporter periplasmic adaptor subunit n=1 Tax=Herbaspirillum sp. alder98 TaxID=2913096 RepID=UPI001CD882BC|nr:efflux RND transporter periplasmic adaptor subunit [Herbaspirillum sp. alder98]MCA1323950.1 efflux RND transporter periplasmic adaptor subunit [Herbaspirillum sp. alder98]
MNNKRIIAAILIGTALAAGAIVWSTRSGHDDHADEAGHTENDSHGHTAQAPANAAEVAAAAKQDDHDDHDDDHGKEGGDQIAFSAEQIRSAGVVVADAALSEMASTLALPGEIRFDADRTAHVVPRAAGVVQTVSVRLGQQVSRGQLLASISSAAVSELRSEAQAAQQRLVLARENHARERALWDERISAEQDLQQARSALREAEIGAANATQKLNALGAGPQGGGSLQIRAPFDGVVVEKHIALGEMVREDTAVLTIADLRSVWAEIDIPASALDTVRVGAAVTVKASALTSSASGKIAYVAALLGEQTRTAKAHAVLANPGGAWRPGMFVTVDVASGAPRQVLAVPEDAIHTLEQRNVVFVATESGFKAQPVRTGRSQGGRTEIVDGLQPGQRYAAVNAFMIKAEMGKSSAEHAH